MNESVFYIPNEYAFATSQSLPKNIQYVYSLVQPLKKNYITIITPLYEVTSTTAQTIFTYTLPYGAYVKQISILPSSNASANGVMYFVQYGTNTISSVNGAYSGASVPTNISFTDGEYPFLNQGDTITLSAYATTSGSYLQLAIILMLVV